MNIIFFSLYLAGLVIITYSSFKKESIADYLNASRSLDWKAFSLSSFASFISSYNIIVGISFAYLLGYYYWLIFLGVLLAYLFIYRWYLQHSSLIKEQNFLTIVDYIGHRYGVIGRKVLNVLLSLSLFFFIILQVSVNVFLFEKVLGIGSIQALIIVLGIVIGYLWFGGFKTVVATDIFQAFLMFLIGFLVFFTGGKNLNIQDFVENISNITLLKTALLFVVIQALSFVMLPDLWQKVYSVKSKRDLKIGMGISFVFLTLFTVLVSLVALNAKFGGVVENPNIFYDILSGSAPSWFTSIVFIGLIAAFMSSLDSSLFSFSSQVSQLFKFEKIEDSLTKKYIRIISVASLVVASLFSLYVQDLLTAIFQMISVWVVLGTVFIFGEFIKISKIEYVLANLVGTAVFLYLLFSGVITQDPLTSLYPSLIVLGYLIVQRAVFYVRDSIKLATK